MREAQVHGLEVHAKVVHCRRLTRRHDHLQMFRVQRSNLFAAVGHSQDGQPREGQPWLVVSSRVADPLHVTRCAERISGDAAMHFPRRAQIKVRLHIAAVRYDR